MNIYAFGECLCVFIVFVVVIVKEYKRDSAWANVELMSTVQGQEVKQKMCEF